MSSSRSHMVSNISFPSAPLFLITIASIVPLRQLHRSMIIQMPVHIERVPQKMGLVSPSSPQALKLGLVEVILQDGLVIGVSALVDDNAGALPRAQTTDIGETLLGDNDVKIVLSLIDMGAHGHNAGDTGRIGLGRAGRRSVHDAVFSGAQEIGGSTETVEHAASHDAGGVGVSVDVDFDGRVHANDSQSSDDLRGVGDLLGAEEKLGCVMVPVLVEALEAIGRETDGCCGCEVQVSRVEEVKEGILKNLGPDLEVLEVGTSGLSRLLVSLLCSG